MGEDDAILRGMRILVVEDEPLLGLEIAGVLEAAGCVVIGPAISIAQAESLMDGDAPDAALLDLNLGEGLRGESIAARLLGRGVPFVFVTAYAREAIDPELRGFSMIRKPVRTAELLSVLAANVARAPGRSG